MNFREYFKNEEYIRCHGYCDSESMMNASWKRE